MPLRQVADQFRYKWRSSKTNLNPLPPSPAPILEPEKQQLPSRKNNRSSVHAAGSYVPAPAPATGTGPAETTPAPIPTVTATTAAPTPIVMPPPPNPDQALNGIGEYIFFDQIGHGKFSKVKLAQHYLTGEKYAVKIIDKRTHSYRVMSRLVREIELMEALDHPNIVHLYETFETTDSLYLVMEYVRGVNLDEFLQQQRPNHALSEQKARDIFRQIVAAVDYCHSRYVVHRDLKTPNILLTVDGQVKLADFGLGNRFGSQRLKTICGSMLYYSPEIITGRHYVGPEIDCWCLGVLLFRMTTGLDPFGHARTVGELKKDVVSANYSLPSHLSDDLKATIRKCLTLERRKRLGVRQVLGDDPWLCDHARLESPFSATSDTDPDEVVRLRTERERLRRQYYKDMEDEKRRGYSTRKTVIYHPIDVSIYFTGSIPHTSNVDDSIRVKEVMRAGLYNEMRVIINQVRLRPIPASHVIDRKSPFQHLFKRFSSNRLRKTTSTLSFSSLYKKPGKDQINYYTIECNVRAVSSTTAVSSLDDMSLPSCSHHPSSTPQQDEYELILLVRSACELLGISYRHESKNQLVCVLTLRNYREDPSKLKDAQEQQQQQQQQQSSRHQSDHQSNSSLLSDHSWTSRLKRLSLPMLNHHGGSGLVGVFGGGGGVQPPWIWSNSIQISSSAAPHSLASTGNHPTAIPMVVEKKNNSRIPGGGDQPPEEGSAVFSIEAVSIASQTRRIVALKFSIIKGSPKVYKLATGWVGGVLSSTKAIGNV